jgi:hypothetical protein
LRKVIARQRHECQKCKDVIEAGEVAVQGARAEWGRRSSVSRHLSRLIYRWYYV